MSNMLFTLLFAIFCLIVVGVLIEFTLTMFFYWLIFVGISFVLSLIGLQEYAWLVFIIFVLWRWFR
ncbi:hypothetical protein IKQ38_04495 [Candidatus Saccharibacteria bacterium]|nr:hypothetical protein [Candidatus Saccharibacteria bacterium]